MTPETETVLAVAFLVFTVSLVAWARGREGERGYKVNIEKHRAMDEQFADYRCNECGEVFTEKFIGEEPHDFYPCPLCDEGEGKMVGL